MRRDISPDTGTIPRDCFPDGCSPRLSSQLPPIGSRPPRKRTEHPPESRSRRGGSCIPAPDKLLGLSFGLAEDGLVAARLLKSRFKILGRVRPFKAFAINHNAPAVLRFD